MVGESEAGGEGGQRRERRAGGVWTRTSKVQRVEGCQLLMCRVISGAAILPHAIQGAAPPDEIRLNGVAALLGFLYI